MPSYLPKPLANSQTAGQTLVYFIIPGNGFVQVLESQSETGNKAYSSEMQ